MSTRPTRTGFHASVLPMLAVAIGCVGLAVYWGHSADIGTVWGTPALDDLSASENQTISRDSGATEITTVPAREFPANAPDAEITALSNGTASPGKTPSAGIQAREPNTEDAIDGPQTATTLGDGEPTLLSASNDNMESTVPLGAPAGVGSSSSPGLGLADPIGAPFGGAPPLSGSVIHPGGEFGGGSHGSVASDGPANSPPHASPPKSQAPSSGPQQSASGVTPSMGRGTPSPTITAGPRSSGAGAPPLIIAGGTAPTPTIAGSTPSDPIAPTATTPGGTAVLPIASTGNKGNSWEFFDPPVAVGYDYALEPTMPGDSLTFGIAGIMVTTKVGSGEYDLWLYDVLTGQFVNSSNFTKNHQPIMIAADPTADPSGAFDVVSFLLGLNKHQDRELGVTNPNLGLKEFSLRGIAPSAGLNPDDPNAFITGLLFAGTIDGSLLITPLAIDSTTGQPVDPPTFDQTIPEPAGAALMFAALAFLLYFCWLPARASAR
jgi:hypothetical protein